MAALSRAAGLSAETKPLTPTELNQLVARVAAQGDPARGESIFRRADLNCMSCHSLSKAGGEVGPDLSSIGQTSPADYIINSILNPDQSIKEQYHTLVVLTNDGQVFQGIVADKDEQRIVLKEATGAPRVVPVASIEDQKAGGSLMPKGLANLMTRTEFVDLVRFLSELGKPGPYAIRSTPTIQRWRVLKPVPESLSDVDSRQGSCSATRFCESDPGRWSTAYAKVAGSLPLDELIAPRRRQGPLPSGRDQRLERGAGQYSARFGRGSPSLGRRRAGSGRRSADVAPTLPRAATRSTLRVDTAARKSREIKVEVAKPSGSPAEFTVVGGH